MKKILEWFINRQVAQHGSFAAFVIGTIANLLGVPLAPPQISLLISAISLVTYILSQLKGKKPQ